MSAGRKPIIVRLWRLQALQSKSACAIPSHYNRATRRCPSGLQAALCHTTSPRPPCPGLSSVHSHCLKPSASYSQCSNFHLLSPGSDVWHLHPQLSEWVFRHIFQCFSQNFCRGPAAGSEEWQAPQGTWLLAWLRALCATSHQLAPACDFGGCCSHWWLRQTCSAKAESCLYIWEGWETGGKTGCMGTALSCEFQLDGTAAVPVLLCHTEKLCLRVFWRTPSSATQESVSVWASLLVQVLSYATILKDCAGLRH